MIRLTFEGHNLPQMDTFSASDPFLIVYSMKNGKKVKVGQTEVVVDSNNPKWIQAVDVEYHFESRQDMRIEVWDADDIKAISDLSK